MRKSSTFQQVVSGAASDLTGGPVATLRATRPRWAVILVSLGLLIGASLYLYGVRAPAARMASLPDAGLPPAVVALSGEWEGLGPEDFPSRLVVEEAHPDWAEVRYLWGAHPASRVQPGWVRVRAKVSPEGKLFWRSGGEFTFRLSGDGTTLVGTREKGGKVAPVVLRRDWS
jgi:hypothetical protein